MTKERNFSQVEHSRAHKMPRGACRDLEINELVENRLLFLGKTFFGVERVIKVRFYTFLLNVK